MATSRWASFVVHHRRALVIAVHLLLWTLSFAGAFLLRFEFNTTLVATFVGSRWLVTLLLVRFATAVWMNAFGGIWRYSGVRDLQTLVQSTTLSTLIFAVLLTTMGPPGFPRSIYVIDWLCSIILVGGLRFASRTAQEFVAQVGVDRPLRRVLIVGAGNMGETLVREMQRGPAARLLPVGFVDDDLRKRHASIHGVRVLGALADTAPLIRRLRIDEVIIAMPAARGRLVRTILTACHEANVPVRTLPSIDQVMEGKVSVQQLRHVAIEDLLGRPSVALDQNLLRSFLQDQVVLITGAGGSIGSELCRQVSCFGPQCMILLDQAEHPLFSLEMELQRLQLPTAWRSYVGDICDAQRMREIIRAERPTVILHAAAHKHVPMMERNPAEALRNNVLGTRVLADLADQLEVERFVMISTDKAVNPTSVMGASKRLAERYVQALASQSGTCFNIVRFGNVLGSQGSVIPIFKEQIARGGPVTITHPDMCRYFMTIPEACQLVLQAAAMGRGGELFVLDMGEPVKIVDLARDLIALSGLVADEDIEIAYIGARSGEKLFEELSLDSEETDTTSHPKVFIGLGQAPAYAEQKHAIDELAELLQRTHDPVRMRAALRHLVPEYCPGDAPRSLTTPGHRAAPPPARKAPRLKPAASGAAVP